jgi:solute carrier family 25 phosphate transporter 3
MLLNLLHCTLITYIFTFISLYAGLGPLWARQVPYTIIKFVAFERIAEGVLCGAVSHPADTMVSKINKLKMEGSLMQKMGAIYYGTPTTPGIRFAGLWKGFGARVVMIGTLTGMQW